MSFWDDRAGYDLRDPKHVWDVGPSASWYEPPEPQPCCALAEDDPDHDQEACLEASAEAAAEARAEQQRDRERDR